MTTSKTNDIGIRNDLLDDTSLSDEVMILSVSFTAPKVMNVNIIARNFHLFILPDIVEETNKYNLIFNLSEYKCLTE